MHLTRNEDDAGSIPAFSTGFEEDGNPLRPGRSYTGFDSPGPDLRFLGEIGITRG